MTDRIQKELPIEEMVAILVGVVKEMHEKMPTVPLPHVVDRVVEPVAMLIFQQVLTQVDPNWVPEQLQVISVAPDSVFIPGPNTLQ